MMSWVILLNVAIVVNAVSLNTNTEDGILKKSAEFVHKTVLSKSLHRTFLKTKEDDHKTVRNVITDPDHLWPGGKIPFVFDNNVPAFTKIEIMAAMQEIEMSSYSGNIMCVMFVPRASETDYVHISWTSGNSGSTSIGRAGGRQDMTVNTAGGRGHDDNLQILLDVIGLIPEVMRPDRDQYLLININNAVSTDPFRVLTGVGTSNFGQQFDYDSLMLGNPYQYARDPAYPVVTAVQSGKVMGQSVSMSTGDATLLQNAYHCPVDSSNVINLLGTMPLVCHFHTDICTFTQDQQDDFDWVVQEGPTPVYGTGPSADYSSGSGKFALAQARGHHNQVARLISPQFPAGQYCFRMNLHMFGSDIETLKVSAMVSSGQSSDLLNHKGPLDNSWYHIYSNIDSKQAFNIQITATMGDGDRGDIGVDDVYMYNGQCIEW